MEEELIQARENLQRLRAEATDKALKYQAELSTLNGALRVADGENVELRKQVERLEKRLEERNTLNDRLLDLTGTLARVIEKCAGGAWYQR